MSRSRLKGVRLSAIHMIIASLILCTACDNADESSTDIQSTPTMLISEIETKSSTNSTAIDLEPVDDTPVDVDSLLARLNEFPPAPDDATSPIGIAWADEDAKKVKKTVDAVTLRISNFTDLNLIGQVTVRLAGLLSEVATMDLGEVQIPARDVVSITISGEDIPLQTTTGVCQATALISVSGQDGYRAVASAESLYYRHLPNYKSLQIFGAEIFMKDEKGKYLDVREQIGDAGLNNASSLIMGRIKGKNGIFKEALASEHGVIFAAGDNNPNMVVRRSFGEAPSDPALELEEMNNEYK